MSTYTGELRKEIDSVTLRGNADKETIRKLASIIFRMDARLQLLEKEVVVDNTNKVVFEQLQSRKIEESKPKTQNSSIRPVQPKTQASKQSDQNPSDKTSEA